MKTVGSNEKYFICSQEDLRFKWVDRLKNLYLVENGPYSLTEDTTARKELFANWVKQAIAKYPFNGQYLVRRLEDNGEPVAIIGEDVKPLYDNPQQPELCVKYFWDCSNVELSTLVTIEYIDCNRMSVTLTTEAVNIIATSTFCMLKKEGFPIVSHGKVVLIGDCK